MLHLILLALALALLQNPGEQAALEIIRTALSQGDLDSAESAAQEVIRNYPNNAQVHYLLAGIRSRQRRFLDAEQEFLRVIELDPEFTDAYLLLDTLYRNLDRTEDALSILNRGLKKLPDNPAIRFQLGQLYMILRNFSKALEILQQIPEEQAPSEYWDTLGKLHTLSGNLANAEQAYRKYLERYPESVRTLHTLSAIALQRGEKSLAWEYIAKARRKAPNSPQILLDFAYISIAENLVGEAAAALQFLLLMQPDNTDAIFELGSAFIHFANFDSSRELFHQYVKLKPNDPMGHAMLGYVLYLSNQFDEARKRLNRALKLDPKLTDAKFYLGMVDFSQAKDENAEKLFREVISQSGDHGRAYLNLGKLYLRKRRIEEAREVLEKAVRIMPADFEVHFQLSRVYAAAGEREKAMHSLQLFNKYQKEKEKREQESRRTPYTQFYTAPKTQD